MLWFNNKFLGIFLQNSSKNLILAFDRRNFLFTEMTYPKTFQFNQTPITNSNISKRLEARRQHVSAPVANGKPHDNASTNFPSAQYTFRLLSATLSTSASAQFLKYFPPNSFQQNEYWHGWFVFHKTRGNIPTGFDKIGTTNFQFITQNTDHPKKLPKCIWSLSASSMTRRRSTSCSSRILCSSRKRSASQSARSVALYGLTFSIGAKFSEICFKLKLLK